MVKDNCLTKPKHCRVVVGSQSHPWPSVGLRRIVQVHMHSPSTSFRIMPIAVAPVSQRWGCRCTYELWYLKLPGTYGKGLTATANVP